MLSLPDFKERQLVVCYAREGQKVSFKNDNLLISDSEGKVLVQRSCHRLFALWIVGQTSLTSGILERSRKFGFPIMLFSYGHRLYGSFRNPTEGNVLLRKRQYAYEALDVAQKLISNKIENQNALLKSLRKKSDDQKQAIHALEEYKQGVWESKALHSILGYEGSASRMFFKRWFEGMDWLGRKPRTKVDPLNATLDIGYTYLFCMMEGILDSFGFDVYKGVYHQEFYQRKSLVCDLVEPFRSVIDRKLRKAWNLGQLKADHFRKDQGRYQLTWEQNKIYTKWLLEALLEEKERMFIYVQSYYRNFMREAEVGSYPNFAIIPEE